MLFGSGRMNFWNIFFENTNAFGFSDLRDQIVPLFYSLSQKRVFKKSHVLSKVGEYFLSLEKKYLLLGEGTSWKKKLGDWLLIILNKQESFYTSIFVERDSKPNSW